MMKWNGGGNSANFNMKKFLITKDTIANGQKVSAGDIVELKEDVGHELCAYGKASVHIEKPKLIHYTEGGPWFENYRNCEFSELWKQELFTMMK